MFSDIKSIFKHSSIYGISTLLRKGIGFIMIPIYTACLSPSDYGILELMDLTMNIISLLIGMRLGTGIIRFYYEYETLKDRNELFSTALIFVFCLTAVIVTLLQIFAGHFAGWILGSESFYRYFQIIFLAMGFQILTVVPESILLAEKNSVVYSTLNLITFLSNISLNILFLVVIKIGVLGLLLSMLITKILNTVILLIIFRKRLSFGFSFKKLFQMINFTLPLVPASFFMFAMHYADRFFIQKFCDLDELGCYSLGYKFGMIISVIISEPFFRIWNTQRFELAKEENAHLKMGLFFTYYAMIVIAAALGISIFIKEIIIIMTPSEYSGATSVVAAITISYVLYGIANFFNLGMMVTYKTKSLAYIQIGVAIFNIIINFFFIQKWGVNGAVIATLLSFFLLAAISLIVSQSLYAIKIEYLRIASLAALYCLLLYISSFITFSLLYSLIFKILLFSSFPLILFLTGFFSKAELEKSKELINFVLLTLRKKTLLKGK